jgi:hypothetical protein
MITLHALPDTFVPTRDALRHVAVHIVARARSQAAGQISLRTTVGGFGTPAFGDDGVRVRVSGGVLVRDADGAGHAAAEATALHGSTLAELASFARVDLDAALDVGSDTPPLGDVAAPLSVDAAAADALAAWYAVTAIALDRAVAQLPASAAPTITRLWPEHFDVALDAAASPECRVNLGGSPGDGFDAEPYAYVGPWTEDRPGDPAFWNAPFGAVLRYAALVDTDDPAARLADFFLGGMRRLAV